MKYTILALLLLCLCGCPNPVCIRPTLNVEPNPIMIEVQTDEEGGLDEEETKDMLSNLELFQGALDRCNSTLRLYNLSIKGESE